MLILPAIDIRGGNCVRLIQGDYSQETVYGDDPAIVALEFEKAGAEWIHLVDLDGAKAGVPVNVETLRSIRSAVSCRLEVGGGIRDLNSAVQLLDLGIDRVILGTILVKDPEFRRQAFGELGEKVVAGIDAKDGYIAVSGWEQTSALLAVEAAVQMEAEGAQRFIVTDIATDGMLTGPNLGFLADFTRVLKSRVIASGGVSSSKDLAEIAAVFPAVEGAIVGKAIYENRISLREELATYDDEIPQNM